MDIRRVSWLQAMLFNEWRGLSNDERDLDIEWNVMHMYSSAQLAKLLAIKRGLDPELAAIAAVLHDIAVVESKKRNRHAELAEPYVRDAIIRFNYNFGNKQMKITEDETNRLVKAITQHGRKEEYSDDDLVELLKDVDSLDRYLHGIKTEGCYWDRCQKAMHELGCKEG